MTQETRDIIYNKKAEQLNKDEVSFINKLLIKKDNEFFIKETLITPPIAFILLPIILNLAGLLYFSIPSLTIMGIVGIFVGGLLCSAMALRNISLKSLGLTRKEWKELKKSGRLKELKQVIKEYNASLKSDLDDLYEKETEIVAEIKTKQEEKEDLVSELLELRKAKEQLKGTTHHYSQEEVAEMLKAEESLLIRAMERVKQTQAILNSETDQTMLDEMGNNIKNKDYLAKALEDCKDLNKE